MNPRHFNHPPFIDELEALNAPQEIYDAAYRAWRLNLAGLTPSVRDRDTVYKYVADQRAVNRFGKDVVIDIEEFSV